MIIHQGTTLDFLNPMNPFMIPVPLYCGMLQVVYYATIVYGMEYLDYNRKRLAQSWPRLAGCLASFFCCFSACREMAPTDEERGRSRRSRSSSANNTAGGGGAVAIA
jgi:hypothetical protein